MVVGPIQIFIIGFSKESFKGKILPELRALGRKGFVRIIDYLFAKKDNKGNILALKTSELTAEEAVRFGAIAGVLIGLGAKDVLEGCAESEIGVFSLARKNFGLMPDDIVALAEDIPKGSSFAVVLLEHCWAVELKKSITDAGGVLLAQGLVSPLALVNLDAEMAITSEAFEQE